MNMFVSPGSVIALLCAGFPFMLFWMYERSYDVVTKYVPDAEYFLLKFAWFLTKVYTYSERRVRKIAAAVNKMVRVTSNKNLILFKDGNVVHKLPFEKMNECDYGDEYDMVFLEYSNDETDTISKYKTHMIRTNLVEEATDYFDICDISFMGLNVIVKDGGNVVKTESVIFGSENYYIVGNVLFDRAFIKYWLMRFHRFEMTEQHTYEVSFFDSTITPHKLEEPEYIQLTKNGFDVIRPNILVKEEEETKPTIPTKSTINVVDETEWEVEPEKNLNNSEEVSKTMPEGNFLHSYFRGSTNWSQMFKSKNE